MNLGKPNPHRKLLNRLLFSEDIRRDIFTLDERTASRFVEGLQQHESPMDPLFMIRRHKDKSMVRSIFTIGSSSSFMDRVVVPFLGWLGQDALSKGTCKQCQQAIVNDLARAPGLLEALLDALRSDEISDEAALLWFIERLLLDDDQDGVEARKSELHVDLVKRLAYSRTPSVKAQAMVLVNGILDPAAGGKSSDGAGESVATMTTLTLGGDSSNGRSVDAIREALPGGRHSNDHADFRSIGIVPTVDEIMCNTIPFLPTPADAQYPHLERQFRLLRHDMVASVIEAVTALASMKKRGSEDDGGKDKITGGGGGGRSGPRTLILPGAKRGSVVVGDRDRSVSVIVHFDWPRDHPLSRMGSGKKRIEYLQPAKGGGGGRVGGAGRNLLKRESLVVLADNNLQPMLLGRIATRDAEWLAGGVTVAGAPRDREAKEGSDNDAENSDAKGKKNKSLNWWNRQGMRPAVGLSFFSRQDIVTVLQLSKTDAWGCLIPLNVGIFSYEPVLKQMQVMSGVPMGDILVDWSPPQHDSESRGGSDGKEEEYHDVPRPAYKECESATIEAVATRFAPSKADVEKQQPLVLTEPLRGVTLPARCEFDISQRTAVANVLRQRVSLVQGPPGTGKTFLGVLLAQTILSYTSERIICVCYTNHALDSFLEDMMSKGVKDIVRIGGGSKNPKLDRCQLRNFPSTGFDTAQSRQYARLKQTIVDAQEAIDRAERGLNRKPSKLELVEWLEDEDQDAFYELDVSAGLQASRNEGETMVGRKGRAFTGNSLVEIWLQGRAKPRYFQDARRLSSSSGETGSIWALDKTSRQELWATWESGFTRDKAKRLARRISACDADIRELAELETARDAQRVKKARVVGCTTTGAAIHHALLTEAGCRVVLVEEAAEVLEAHVLTALSPDTKHLIMIGDHKQLRPKVEQYQLRVESRRGFNLDESLFERLVKAGYPHTTLELQHRMPPEISALVKGLTYPELRNGPRTLTRPRLRGVRDRVCFVAHNHPEETAACMRQRQDEAGGSSKVNRFEVEMVTKTAGYLLLQGYEPDQIVVLTPYLAQLRELRDALDGAVSDQDAADMAAALRKGEEDDQTGKQNGNHRGGNGRGSGAPTTDSEKVGGRKGNSIRRGGTVGQSACPKPKIRVATVDNYQGEESDVVIGSFVRSNEGGSMGFVGDPNRLNVAISRARHGMILFGDLDFFTSDCVRNKSGQGLWLGFKTLLEEGSHVYRDGLPVICEKHKTCANLVDPPAFDQMAPDGGCLLPCGQKLGCEHLCRRRCHPGDDEGHTRGSETCGVVINEMCAKGHTSKRRCRDPAGLPCQPCERERLAAEREAEEQENTRRRREEDREKAAARLAAARRAAANEREKLSHGLELLRLERETQRAEVDAEEARASAGAAQARLTGIRTRGDEQVDPAADRNVGGQATSGVREDIERNAKRREDELNARFVETGKAGAENLTSTRKAGVEARVGNDNNISKKRKGRNDARTRRKPAEVENQANSCSAADGLPASTLRLVAQAAENGDADGILKALEAVPKAEWERASHELALAVGDTALAWFPLSYGGGREPQLVSAPTGRTAQAIKMMSQGQWVGARRVLAAALKEDEGNTQPPAGSVNPHIIFALALCDFNLGGAATAPQLLRKLQAAELEIWPGSTEGAACPGARAFPLAALVRATLVTAVFEDTNVPNGSPGTFSDAPADENGELDPRVQACSSAIAFMRASAHARQSGGIDGRIWEQAAEMVVRKTGGALAVALWGPEGGGGTGTVDGDDRKEALGERVVTEWKKLKAQWGVTSSAMEELLDMSGLDTIKLRFLNIAQSAALDKERGYDLAERSYNIRLEGNPGTGKTTVARLYYLLLKEVGVFDQAEQKARRAQEEAQIRAKKKAAAAEKARQEAERQAYRSAGVPYNPPPASSSNVAASPAPAPAPTPGSAEEKAKRFEGFVETTGADLADNGVGGAKKMLEKIRTAGGGVLFVDEAYTLEPKGGGGGKQVLNYLLAEIENRRGELVVAFAGYAKDMESLFEYNEGLPSRFPETLRFADYSDALLLHIFKGLMKKKKGRSQLRLAPGTGEGERWAKVAIVRLGRRRGTRGFGNARAVRVLFDRVLQRQTDRLSSIDGGSSADDSVNGASADDRDPFVLTKPDLLGVTVAELADSASWNELESMVGLGRVKDAVKALAEVVKTNVMLEEEGKLPRAIALNRCMLGNPGTGKTTVAKLFAGILADLGLLSKGEVVLKTASDFVGSVLGESESKTRSILKASEGCVLVIDEAYSLGGGGFGAPGGGRGGGSGGDPYRVAVVDTLVEQVQNVPGEDRCVLLLGYSAEMEDFMRNTNPGLARRFALDNAFVFDDYTDEELLHILRGKIAREQLTAGLDALMTASDMLAKKRATASHFGNGGDVANLLSEAKLRKERRRGSDGSMASRLDPELLPQDFDPEYGQGLPDGSTLAEELFGDLIGCRDIKAQLSRIRSTFLLAEKIGRDPRETINLNFRFTGAPGTGKTTVAQRVGRMFKKLGVIHSDEVVTCSPSDFQTGYVGQAGLKTKEVMDKAIGKVLFVDEAYGLNPGHGGGVASFMHEVVDQLVQCLTDDKYKGNMVCVVAGYAAEIDDLMDANPGLASRFPETLHFPNFGVEDCCRLLEGKLKKDFSTELAPNVMAAGPAGEGHVALGDILLPLVQAPRFGNGRTITDLAKRVFTEIGVRVESGGAAQADPRASAADVRRSTAAVLQQMSRVARVSSASASVSRAREPPIAVSSNNQSARPPPETTSVVTVKTEEKQDGHWQDVNDIVQMETKEILDTPSFDADDGFFSAADRQTLRAALSIADIAEDSPDINGGNSDLRRVLLLPQEAGGIGLSKEEADTFMRGVDADREALKRALVEATEVEKEEEARMDAMKNETSDAAEAITTAVESGVDQETLKLLEALQRAKEEALKKAREEMERQQALERAAQAALKRMGKCVAGFRWIRQSGGGWRCAGGTHHVSSGEVAAEMAREPSR